MNTQPEKLLSAFELSLLEQPDLDEQSIIPLRAGEVCPQCGNGWLEYSGSLELVCDKCGFSNGGGGGCT